MQGPAEGAKHRPTRHYFLVASYFPFFSCLLPGIVWDCLTLAWCLRTLPIFRIHAPRTEIKNPSKGHGSAHCLFGRDPLMLSHTS